MRKLLPAVLTVTLAASPVAAELDWIGIADRIAQQMALQDGEKVLLVSHPGIFEEVIAPLRLAVIRAGAVDVGVMQVLPMPIGEGGDLELRRRSLMASTEALAAMYQEVDVAVLLPGASPAHPEYAAMSANLREGRGRTVHFHWGGDGPFTSAIPVAGHSLPSHDVRDRVYQRALLQADYGAIASAQRRFEAELREGEVLVTTSLGTDLTFQVGDRVVSLQDGDASAARAARATIFVDRDIELPCGVIRVAPLEETVEGILAFPPSHWNGELVEGLKLRFEKGRVVEVTADSGADAVEAEMEQGGDAARSFREFGLGFNPELAVPEDNPWIPYYGYGAGVVRLSLGDNSELGGNVRGGYVRWNFFTDATVTVGDVVWVRDGSLTLPD